MVLSVPNILTYLRIAAIPLLIGCFYIPAWWAPWAALAIFIAAAVTDYFDGYLARIWRQSSELGKLLDPIADKMLVTATILMLVALDRITGLTVIPAVVILLREVLISGLREFLAGMNALGLPVSRLAKWKTAIQMAAIGVLIAGRDGNRLLDGLPVREIGEFGIWVAAVLTLVTGWVYLREGLRQAMSPEKPKPPAKALGEHG